MLSVEKRILEYNCNENETKRPRVPNDNADDFDNVDNVDSDNNEIPYERERDDSCTPGVEAEFDVVTSDCASLRVAVKPPTTRQNIVVDVLIGCDATGSMTGDGAYGMQNTLSNFDVLVENSLINDKERATIIRKTTNIHFFRFGETAKHFDQETNGFFTLDDSKEVAKSIAKTIKFDDCFTNFEDATHYAADVAMKRSLEKASSDNANGVHRVFVLLLLTDGSVNDGLRDPSAIINKANSTISGVISTPFSVFAIGLGGSTNPLFLSKLCSTGFWKHVIDRTNPADAFQATLGRIMKSVNVYNVLCEIEIQRDGQNVFEKTVHSKHFGLVTPDTCRARIIDLPIPEGLKLHDKIKITSRIGFGDEFVTTVKVGLNASYTTESVGLLDEAVAIEKAVQKLKNQILRNTGEEIYNTGTQESYAVRRFMRSHEELVQNTTMGSILGTAKYIQNYKPSIHDDHSVQSSFSQIES